MMRFLAGLAVILTVATIAWLADAQRRGAKADAPAPDSSSVADGRMSRMSDPSAPDTTPVLRSLEGGLWLLRWEDVRVDLPISLTIGPTGTICWGADCWRSSEGPIALAATVIHQGEEKSAVLDGVTGAKAEIAQGPSGPKLALWLNLDAARLELDGGEFVPLRNERILVTAPLSVSPTADQQGAEYVLLRNAATGEAALSAEPSGFRDIEESAAELIGVNVQPLAWTLDRYVSGPGLELWQDHLRGALEAVAAKQGWDENWRIAEVRADGIVLAGR